MFPDISEFQGAVDWDALGGAYHAGEIEAVAMRAGFGTVRPDHQFARNQQECRARGIPAIFYWFSYPALNSPQSEASMFNAVVGPLLPREAMVGDFEDDPPFYFPRGPAGVEWASEFLNLLQAPQNAAWFYTYSSLFDAIGLQALVGTWPFWWADYSDTPDSARSYAIARQFTDQGATPGVGQGDLSRVLRPPLTQWLTPAPGQEDDMFTDEDRARLGDKLFGFDLAAGRTKFVPGPDQNTEFNIVSQGNDGARTTVRVFAYDTAGNVLGQQAYVTNANLPNQHGPTQSFGVAAALGATGACSLGFVNDGAGDVYVTLH
jgi:Glycosyl hydrolases family 25